MGLEACAGESDLIICDSPYNQGEPYEAYDDNKSYDDFLQWCREWLLASEASLKKTGSLFVFAPDEWASEIDTICRKELQLYRRSWIIWGYGFGVASQKNFARCHTHILYYTKSKTKFTFNADPVRVPSDRQLVYGDKRAMSKGKLPGNVWVLTKAMMESVLPKASDIWYESRICGTFGERKTTSPNQIPLPIMERIILSASNPGDLVVDPFGGTFGSGIVAIRTGRRYYGCDISKRCVVEGFERLTAESRKL